MKEWEQKRLSDIADVCMGNSPPGDSYNEVGDGIPLINGPVEFSAGPFGETVRSKFTTKPTRYCKQGDLILCVRGSTTGRTNVASFDACIGRGVASIRAHQCQQYLNHFIVTQRQKIFNSGNGSTFPSISRDQLNDVEIPLPPLPEQRRIVGILDAADAIRRKRQQAIALTEQFLRSTFLDMFGDPVTNPKGWPRLRFEELLQFGLRNGLSPSSKGTVSGRVLTLSAITRGRFDREAWKEARFDETPSDEKYVDRTDFLICRGNGNLELCGSGRFPTVDMPATTFPDTMIAARIDVARLEPMFLEHVWESRHVRDQIERGARTTNGTHKVNQKLLESIEVIVPPKSLQEKFADVGKRHLMMRSRLCNEANDNLFNSLVQRAFRGEL